MTGDYATTDFETEILGSNLPPWKLVIDLNDRTAFEEHFRRYGNVEVTRNGESRTFTPKEFFAALVRLAEKPRTCHMVRRDDLYTREFQDLYECDRCGEQVIRDTCMGKSEPPRFCPGCGAEVTR